MSPADSQRARRGVCDEQRGAPRQLIMIARGLFAERGFDGTSVEEIAAHAEVSKPVRLRALRRKEGLYAWWSTRGAGPRDRDTRCAGYAECQLPGIVERGRWRCSTTSTPARRFPIIARDSSMASAKTTSVADTSPTFASILSDIPPRRRHLGAAAGPPRVQDRTGHGVRAGLVGMVASPVSRAGYPAPPKRSWPRSL